MSPEQAASFMARALRLAEQGRYTTHPNPRVGCVIARDGQIVGQGFHARAGEPHAEVNALRAARGLAHGAEVFVTLEPCCHHGRTPPCVEALIAAGVHKVWAAMHDPNPRVAGQGIARLRAAGIEVEAGLMQRDAEQLNRGFISRMVRGRPLVTLKLAASLDGRTAMAGGESQWITSEEARADGHRLRAEAGAVLTSSATVLADDPALTVRLPGQWRQPDRIVLDTQARVPADAKVWNRDGARQFWLTAADPSQHSLPLGEEEAKNSPSPLRAEGQGAGIAGPQRIFVEPEASAHISLSAALLALSQHEINHVLVECGPHLAGALLQQQLVDEIVFYLAPSLLGHEARPLALLPGLSRLHERVNLQILDVRQIGPDLRLAARPI